MNFIENGVKQNSLIFQNASKGVAFHHAGMMTEERNIGKSPTIAHVRGQICVFGIPSLLARAFVWVMLYWPVIGMRS